ncbi:MAG TPA: hypothetical protein ENI23_06890 [bacterium]|nr:hypothetical protein [bacterium]
MTLFDFGISGKDILLVVLGTIASIFIAYIARKIFEFYRILIPFFKVWGFKNNETVYLINGIIELNSTDLKDKFVLGPGDVNALVAVSRTLEKRYKSIKIKNLYSKQLSALDMMNENIVSIGGLKRNTVTKRLMGLIDCKHSFDDEGNMINNKTNKQYSPVKAESNDYYVEDYGFISKAKLSSEAEKWVFVIAGCHTEGVMGAARYISSLDYDGEKRLRELAKEFKNEPFQIAVKVNIIKDEMGVIEIGKIERVF